MFVNDQSYKREDYRIILGGGTRAKPTPAQPMIEWVGPGLTHRHDRMVEAV